MTAKKKLQLPMRFREAVSDLLKVQPPEKTKKSKPRRKARK